MNAMLGDFHRSRQLRKMYTESVFEVHGVSIDDGEPLSVHLREKHGHCLGVSIWFQR